MAGKRRTEPSGAVPQPGSGDEHAGGSEADRRERIAVAAYYNAERRGFQAGGDVDDWLEAEKQVDARGPEKGVKGEASARRDGNAQASAGALASGRPDFPDLNEAGIEHIEPDDVAKWARRLKVPAPRLREAIKRVGPVVSDVKQFLDSPDSRS
jgi:hypothetical protein